MQENQKTVLSQGSAAADKETVLPQGSAAADNRTLFQRMMGANVTINTKTSATAPKTEEAQKTSVVSKKTVEARGVPVQTKRVTTRPAQRQPQRKPLQKQPQQKPAETKSEENKESVKSAAVINCSDDTAKGITPVTTFKSVDGEECDNCGCIKRGSVDVSQIGEYKIIFLDGDVEINIEHDIASFIKWNQNIGSQYGGVKQVIVKGTNYQNVYYYDGTITSDQGLVAPSGETPIEVVVCFDATKYYLDKCNPDITCIFGETIDFQWCMEYTITPASRECLDEGANPQLCVIVRTTAVDTGANITITIPKCDAGDCGEIKYQADLCTFAFYKGDTEVFPLPGTLTLQHVNGNLVIKADFDADDDPTRWEGDLILTLGCESRRLQLACDFVYDITRNNTCRSLTLPCSDTPIILEITDDTHDDDENTIFYQTCVDLPISFLPCGGPNPNLLPSHGIMVVTYQGQNYGIKYDYKTGPSFDKIASPEDNAFLANLGFVYDVPPQALLDLFYAAAYGAGTGGSENKVGIWLTVPEGVQVLANSAFTFDGSLQTCGNGDKYQAAFPTGGGAGTVIWFYKECLEPNP